MNIDFHRASLRLCKHLASTYGANCMRITDDNGGRHNVEDLTRIVRNRVWQQHGQEVLDELESET